MSSEQDCENLDHAETLLNMIERASGLLMGILHLAGGSCGRGTEEGFQAVRNHSKGPREYFIIGKRLASVPAYGKARSMHAGRLKIVSRHPDKLSGNLFKAFVLIAMPMRAAIRLSRLPSNATETERAEAAAYTYILAEKSHRVAAIEKMANAWRRHGLGMGGRDYRQWFGGYANDKSLLVSEVACARTSAEDDFDPASCAGSVLQVQAGHSASTARSHYGRSANGLSPNGTLDPRTIKQMIRASDEWLKDIGLEGKTPKTWEEKWKRNHSVRFEEQRISTSAAVSNGEDCKSDTPRDSVELKSLNVCVGEGERGDKASGTKVPSTGSSIPEERPCDSQERGGTGSELDAYNDTEEVPGDHIQHAVVSRQRCTGDAENPEPAKHKRRMYIFRENPDILKALRLGLRSKSANFRSKVQKEAMEIVCRGQEDVLFVDRTGGGKSAVIFGPALSEEGVTVFVCPLISLQIDIETRCQGCKLPVRLMRDIIDGVSGIPLRGIIVASPEQVGTEEYEHALGLLWSMGRLCRIVVDEVHLIVMSEHYRQCMTRMRQVRPDHVDVQLVMMTATAPPSLVSDILCSVGCSTREVRILRGSFKRDNIELRVRELRSGHRITLTNEVVEQVCQAITETRHAAGKHLVSTLTRGDVDDIYHALQNDSRLDKVRESVMRYHSGMTGMERMDSMKAWQESTRKTFVMIATDGFGVGIDAPDVRRVIVAGSSRSIIDFWQVTGRVGRDGCTGKVVVLYHHEHSARAGSENETQKQFLKEFMSWASDETSCRVQKLAKYLNGEDSVHDCVRRRNSGEMFFETCDNCAYRSAQEYVENSGVRKRKKPESDAIGCEGQKMMKMEVESKSNAKEGVVLSTNEIRQDIEMLRTRARRMSMHCAPCLLRTGKCGSTTRINGGSVRHSIKCFAGRCLRCLEGGHDASECRNVTKPSRENGIGGCKACFLLTVRGLRIHEGFGPAWQGCNEFGSVERCPFRTLIAVSMGSRERMKKNKNAMDTLSRASNASQWSGREFCNWLIQDTSGNGPGIVAYAEHVMKEFSVSP